MNGNISANRKFRLGTFKLISAVSKYFLPDLSIKGTAILYYHQIRKEVFSKQINFLKKHLDIIDIDTLIKNMKNGKVPKNKIVITFDDGYKSNYKEVFPVAQKEKVPITIFLTTDYIGKTMPKEKPVNPGSSIERELLTWEEITEMNESNLIDFGAHTCTHPRLDKIEVEKVRNEILDSKSIIEDKLQTKVKYFAYPYGIYDKNSLDIVKKNFKLAFTTQENIVNNTDNYYTIGRIEITEDYDVPGMIGALRGYKKKLKNIEGGVKSIW